jgi:hypothetical protein
MSGASTHIKEIDKALQKLAIAAGRLSDQDEREIGEIADQYITKRSEDDGE